MAAPVPNRWANDPHPRGVPLLPAPPPVWDPCSHGGDLAVHGTGECADSANPATAVTAEVRWMADPGLGPEPARAASVLYIASLAAAGSGATFFARDAMFGDVEPVLQTAPTPTMGKLLFFPTDHKRLG